MTNLLSFGARAAPLPVEGAASEGADDGATLELQPLNVLIGPNGSGKSNLIDVLSLLRAMPTDLSEAFRDGGGVQEWIWKGTSGRGQVASLDVTFELPKGPQLRHHLSFRADLFGRLSVADERIEDREGKTARSKPFVYFSHEAGGPMLRSRRPGFKVAVGPMSLRSDQSILAQHNAPDLFPEMASIRSFYSSIAIYRDWTTGRTSELRKPQPADLPDDALLPSGRNLAIVLNALQRHPASWDALNEAMRRFHPHFRELRTLVQGGTVQLFLLETGLEQLVPATRMSEGTLRYLALLAVLLHPEPPPLIALEEPELGLHPDLVDDLARLLVEASSRTQVVVTTHSDHLVSALSDSAGSVVVTERGEHGTRFHRLEPARLQAWLEKYRLGELWMMGEIGGTRW